MSTIKGGHYETSPAVVRWSSPDAHDATAIKAEDLQESLSQVLRLTARTLQRHPAAAQEIAEIEAVCREMWGRLEKAREAAAK